MTDTQDLAHCNKCGEEWVLPDVSVYGERRGHRRDIERPAGLRCPFCQSADIKIIKEKI